jgi:hypothetical protein
MGLLLIGSSLVQPLAAAADEATAGYAMIQWWGNAKTQVVFPDGHVETLYGLLPGLVVPQGANERAYIMTQLINKLTKEGYEYVGMASGEEILMRRVK